MKISKMKGQNFYRAFIPKPNGGYAAVYGKTKKIVKEKAEKLTMEIQSGNFAESNNVVFKNWTDEWLENYLINVSNNTKVTYQAHIKNHILPYFGKKRLQKITHLDVQRFINGLSKKLSPKTIKNIHMILRRLLKDARNSNLISTNPADNIILPKIKHTETDVLDKFEAQKFIDIAYQMNNYYADAFEFLLLTGLRISEFIGLTVEQYNPDTRELKIDRQYNRKLKEYTLPKHDVIRSIQLGDRAHEIIMQHIEDSKWVSENLTGVNQSKAIFLSENYNIINDGVIRRAFKKVAKEYGKPDLRIHDLRHSHTTISLDLGIEIKTVSQNLGHASESFTLNRYAHSTQNMQNEAAKKFNSFWEK